MSEGHHKRVGLILPKGTTKQLPETSRVASLFIEFKRQEVPTELILYSDEKMAEVETQILKLDLVMVWVNPIHDGHDRTIINAMLRRVAENGVFVSSHPDIIDKIGTKDVLYHTKHLDWGSDTLIYRDFDEFKSLFPDRLKTGPRVLKQDRGNGGDGIWRVELLDNLEINHNSIVSALHAKRGSLEEEMTIFDFYSLMKRYFDNSGHLIDQEFHSRLSEGMIRCYMSLDKVIGFGHQIVTALVKPKNNIPLNPPPRYYFPKHKREFQSLRNLLEAAWINEMQKILDIPTNSLPLLWDADFFVGPKDDYGNDTYVLCEINVSSVLPYPEDGDVDIVNTVKKILGF